MAEVTRDTADRHIPASTCLGCGCTCDDIEVVVRGDRIIEARNACSLGVRWYGGDSAPTRIHIDGTEAHLEDALFAAARLLASAQRPLIYLAADVSCEAQREAVALADALRARVESLTSTSGLPFLLGGQERGCATATLGEVRNRADLVVFWGVDPTVRYPRFTSRYAVDPRGLHVPDGRRSRRVISVSVGERLGPSDGDLHVAVTHEAELDLLVATRAVLASNIDTQSADQATWQQATFLAARLREGRYVVIVAEGEFDEVHAGSLDYLRAETLIALTQDINAVTRAALLVLRGGGNRSGADSVLTSQTGFPASVDYAGGWPVYRAQPNLDATQLLTGIDAVLVIGSPASIRPDLIAAFAKRPCVVIGPSASESALSSARALIDCGLPGIHTGGTVVRMDDVAVPARAVVNGPPDPAQIVGELRRRSMRTTQ